MADALRPAFLVMLNEATVEELVAELERRTATKPEKRGWLTRLLRR